VEDDDDDEEEEDDDSGDTSTRYEALRWASIIPWRKYKHEEYCDILARKVKCRLHID
jgi:hypothetical protein